MQIQRDQFRIYGGSSSPGRKNSNKTFDKLVEIGYLSPTISEFKGNLKKDGKKSRIKVEKYCSYGNHLYQYWNISDRLYDYLVDETIRQLKIAKECIEKGLSFKE